MARAISKGTPRLGIDFGTTRVVVAAADRGNYPVLPFETSEGAVDWFPPVVALRGGDRRYGWDAWALQGDPEWTIVRSLKRLLEDAGPETELEVDGVRHPLLPLLAGMAGALRHALGRPDAPEVMLGVPANANSNQRYLTVETFRHGGFRVLGLLNEPSAAAVEFGHGQSIEGRLLVYDLGGGTFDASLVELDERARTVVASEGIASLGGDDFDQVLAELAAGEERMAELSAAELFRLLEECRRQKETLHPNTRRITVDLDHAREGWGQVAVPIAEFYERCRPLIEATVSAVSRLVGEEPVEALYVTGGGSELPLVSRMLREVFGRRVRRSAYTRSATAIGLAIQADAAAGYPLRDVFSQNFGVWREGEDGRAVVFDVIFPRGTRLPAPGGPPLEVRRLYTPVHNIGHFRYLEASQIDTAGQPSGDIAVWDEVRFPLDPALADRDDLERASVERSTRAKGQEIEERYVCQPTGTLAVTIANVTSRYERNYPLGRWAGRSAVVSARGQARRRR
ncbi:MAG TPA: Hsp70 family protein [Candidatus Methylomirabilis sp.]|nr:Hsp70 family protein [Candidatus Methylomirabilis sp.]